MEEDVKPTLSLRDIYDVLFLYKKSIIIIFVTTLFIVILGVYLLPKSYEANASLLVKLGRENISILTAPESSKNSLITTGLNKEDINSEKALLINKLIIEKVVDKLGLEFLFPESPVPETLLKKIKYYMAEIARNIIDSFNKFLYAIDLEVEVSDYDGAVQRIIENLSVEQVSDSHILEVKLEWFSPHIAKEIIQNLLDFYFMYHLEIHSTPGGYDFFQRQVKLVSERLNTAKNELKALKEKQGIVSLEDQKRLLLEKLSDFRADLKNSKTLMAETKINIKELKKQLSSLEEKIQLTQSENRNPIVDNLKTKLLELEFEKEKLLIKYNKDSRPVISIENEIKKVIEQISEANKNVISDITTGINPVYEETTKQLLLKEVQLNTLTKKVKMLEDHINSYQMEIESINKHSKEIERLNLQILIDEDNYKMYTKQLEEARITMVLDKERIVNVKIIEPVWASPNPVSPNKGLFIGLGFMLGLVLGIGFAFIAGYLDHSIKSEEDIKKYLGLPLLASISEKRIKKKNKKKRWGK